MMVEIKGLKLLIMKGINAEIDRHYSETQKA